MKWNPLETVLPFDSEPLSNDIHGTDIDLEDNKDMDGRGGSVFSDANP